MTMNVLWELMCATRTATTRLGATHVAATLDTPSTAMDIIALVSTLAITNNVVIPKSDINECTLGTDTCAQICHNSPGSYTCSCWPGYTGGYNCTSNKYLCFLSIMFDFSWYQILTNVHWVLTDVTRTATIP